jgi:hypothetical protein
MAPVRPILPRLWCSNETVRNTPKHEFWVQWSGSGAFVLKNFEATSFSELVRLRYQFGQFLHQLSCSNEMVQNAPKHEFSVQWSGSGAFVAKNSDATLFSELVR